MAAVEEVHIPGAVVEAGEYDAVCDDAFCDVAAAEVAADNNDAPTLEFELYYYLNLQFLLLLLYQNLQI